MSLTYDGLAEFACVTLHLSRGGVGGGGIEDYHRSGLLSNLLVEQVAYSTVPEFSPSKKRRKIG